jgi:hypothetical protein
MLNPDARNDATPTLSMLKEEVIAQHGSIGVAGTPPHPAGALARRN